MTPRWLPTRRLMASIFTLTMIGVTNTDAQRGPTVKIPFAPPDLVVTVSAPAQITQAGTGSLQIIVDNTLTPVGSPTPFGHILGGSAANAVFVAAAFTGLIPLTATGDSALQCGLSGGIGSQVVACNGGAIPAGGRATIVVSVKQADNCRTRYCGPVYTDAVVDPGSLIAERQENNNRAVSVTDVVSCIE